ncbi:MAG: GGDEF domain-containing protein, partial [Gammaproteobacteria bacterium]|nr:GGDEF domain-containing protein [Gammaproteobacteria bacterium]
MNQLAFAVGALAGLVCTAAAFGLLWRLRRQPATPYDAQHLAVFEQWPTTAMALDPATMRWVSGNPASLRNLGYTLDELRALKFEDIFRVEGPDGRGLVVKLLEATTRTPLEMHQRCADGSERNVEATCYRIEVSGRQLLAVAVHDVTIRRKVETQLLAKHQQLDHLAHHDHLTGLPNRLYLAAHLPDAIEDAKGKGTVLAVLFLDLDRFKHVNDSRGHETGDKLLKTVAQRVRSTMRADDLVVRMGGDEFVVVMRGIKSTDQVNDAAARINRALSAPMVVDGRTLVTTVSIGVALYPYDGADMGELL